MCTSHTGRLPFTVKRHVPSGLTVLSILEIQSMIFTPQALRKRFCGWLGVSSFFSFMRKLGSLVQECSRCSMDINSLPSFNSGNISSLLGSYFLILFAHLNVLSLILPPPPTQNLKTLHNIFILTPYTSWQPGCLTHFSSRVGINWAPLLE